MPPAEFGDMPSGSTRQVPRVLLVATLILLLLRVALGIFEHYNPPRVEARLERSPGLESEAMALLPVARRPQESGLENATQLETPLTNPL